MKPSLETDRPHTIEDDSPLRPFDQSLPMTLMRARETTMRFFRPLLAEYDLTEQQWRVLRALSNVDAAIEVGQLAAATNLLGPSLTRILVNLTGRELTARSVAAHDQRRGLISLTAQGHRLVATIAPRSEAQYRTIEARYGKEKLSNLVTLLNELADLEETDLEETL